MALTNVELYEALKGPVGEEAARLMAEAWPTARDMATRHDIAELAAATKHDLKDLEVRLLRWMIVMFAPLWLGVFGILATLIAKT